MSSDTARGQRGTTLQRGVTVAANVLSRGQANRPPGYDAGLEQIRAGWATTYVFEVEFARWISYRDTENVPESANLGKETAGSAGQRGARIRPRLPAPEYPECRLASAGVID